jgi:TIR domain
MAKYKYDVFVSFSHLDDRSPSNECGCVTAFRDALSIWLGQRLGRNASIWHDSRLSGQDVLDDTIREALQNTAVLVVLYSAGYASSEYCAKEREWFARSPLRIGDQSRVLTVRLVNIPYGNWPKELKGCRGFDFFSQGAANDPTGYPLRRKDSAFETRVQEVVVGIEVVLNAIEAAPGPVPLLNTPDAAGLAPQSNIVVFTPPGPNSAPIASQEEREFALLKEDFKADFQDCFKQIKLLSARKDFHDQLHELQFKFYTPVFDSLPGVGTTIDGPLLDIVKDHCFTLGGILENLRGVVTRYEEYLPEKERALPEEVAKAYSMLEDSVRRSDLVSLRAAVRKFDRVLAVWPSQMNTKLTENARELALGALAKKLQKLCDKSATFKQRLGGGASQLEDLVPRISDLAAIHDDWQSFDVKLRLLEANLSQSLQDIEDIWPDLKDQANMYAQNPESWAKRLVYWGGEVDLALKRQSIADVKRCFIRFSSAARERFYVADQNLKSGCQSLQRVGDPIEAFLKAG